MPFKDLFKTVFAQYGPALELRRILPLRKRRRIEQLLTVGMFGLLALCIVTYAVGASAVGNVFPLSFLTQAATKLYALFLLVFAARFVFSALEALHRSYYFHGLELVLKEGTQDSRVPVTWEVATIVADTHPHDITRAFLHSLYGEEVLFRAGLTPEAYNRFYETRTPTLTADMFLSERDAGVTLASYARSIYKQDAAFAQLLAQENIHQHDLVQAAEWVARIEHTTRYKERWYSRDNLGRVPGLGKTWSYGETWLLERYGHDLAEDPIYRFAVESVKEENDEVESLEAVLSRSRQSNALLIGKEGSGMRERVAQLYYKIREGHALPQLEAKRVFVIDLEAIISAKRDKAQFEVELARVLDHAVRAGNIVLYFEHLAATIASATTIGTDLVDALAPLLESAKVQIVATTDDEAFHKHLARDARLMQYFDTIQMHDIDDAGLLGVIEDRAYTLERKTGVACTYPAVAAVVRMARQYFPDGVMPDKALDLLEELVPLAQEDGARVVTVSDVERMVSHKTGVPLGTPTEAERSELLNLEAFLHERVVGQDTAVSAVARALRRARAGVGSTDRPMGSFLFLGPTGVGKTETAKALAEALFKDDEAMVRLDMSEFQGIDAVARLIGSEETGEAGRLPVLIRERPYGVLLLDEFEKSDRNVHDLFLQILDEGQFTDAFGKKVNARNLLIIATSNAGADLVWQWVEQGKNILDEKRTLVDELVNRALFRPEFLNRFDDIVLFHPLQEEHIARIARLQLASLAKRLQEKGIELAITDELVQAVARVGYDPRFGGRPMRRAIKDTVEQVVADKLLDGSLRPGMKFEITGEELAAK